MTGASTSLACTLAILVATVQLARADLQPAAKQEYERGLAHGAAGDHAAAIAAFDRAYALEPAPVILYSKAQVQRVAGACTDAIATYRAFLDTRPNARDADAARANMTRCWTVLLDRGRGHEAAAEWLLAIAAYRAYLATQPPSADDALAAVGRAQRGLADEAAKLEVTDCAAATTRHTELLATQPPEPLANASRAAITRCDERTRADAAEAAGDCATAVAGYQTLLDGPPEIARHARTAIDRCERRDRRRVLVLRGRERKSAGDCRQAATSYAAVLGLEPTPDELREANAALDDCARPPPTTSHRLAIGLAAGAVVSWGTSAVFVLRARDAADRTSGAESSDEWQRAHDAWRRDRVIAGVAFGVGTALAAAAVTRWVWTRKAAPTIAVGRGTAALVVEGRW